MHPQYFSGTQCRQHRFIGTMLGAGLLFPGLLDGTGEAAAADQWLPPGSGQWHDIANWSSGAIPNAPGASVLIGPSMTNAANISLVIGQTRVGDLTLDSEFDVSIIGSTQGRLTFAAVGIDSEARLAAQGGGLHSLSFVRTDSHLNVDVAGDTGLFLTGTLVRGTPGTERMMIRKTGAGVLDISELTSAVAWRYGSWNILEGVVRFGSAFGGAGLESANLRLDGGAAWFAGSGTLGLAGLWEIAAGGGTVGVEQADRSVFVTSQLTGTGKLTKTGAGALSVVNTDGGFVGDVQITAGTLTATGPFAGNIALDGGGLTGISGKGQELVIQGGYVDSPLARLVISSFNETNLVRAITFENGRSNVITAPISVADQSRGGIAAGRDTVVEVRSLVQVADHSNQQLYLSTYERGELVLGATAQIDSTLASGRGRTTQYSDDGSGRLRLAPGFVADYLPADPTAGWSGLSVLGGTLVSSESDNLPRFLEFAAPRFALENHWQTEFSNQRYSHQAAFLAPTRITTVTDLELNLFTLTAAGQVTKDGPGTLVLEHDPLAPVIGTPIGLGSSIIVAAGTLEVNNLIASAPNLAVTVNHGATLSGKGSLGVLVAAGTVAPGTPAQKFATLTALTLDLAGPMPGTLAVDLGTSPLDVDRLSVLGDVSLQGADLRLTLDSEPTPFIEYVIISKLSPGSVTGTFAQGSSVSADFGGTSYPFDILYHGGDGNDVVLVLIPEPGVASLALLGAGVWCLGRRRNGRG